VLNNIGADADLIVWIDWDRSGEFDSTEAQSVTISPSSSYQVQTPTWNSISPTAGYYFGRARLMPTKLSVVFKSLSTS
jgi:chlorite dismutase